MTAVPAIMLEPVGNLVRVGLETASQLQRKAPAKARYIVGSGQEASILANTPAIPWTSGFGSNANAPTTAGTIDLIGSYTPWVVFLVHTAGTGTFAPGQMYVAKLTDWGALAQEGTRILVPLDLYRLHAAEYAGADLTTQTIAQHGNTIASPVSVGATSDSAGGTVAFPVPYPVGVTPDVTLTSRDPDFSAELDQTHAWGGHPGGDVIESGFGYVVTRLRSLTHTAVFDESVVIAASASSVVHGVVFMTDLGYTFNGPPSIHVESSNPDYVATVQPASASSTGFNLQLTYKPAALSGNTDKAPTGITIHDYNGDTGDTDANHHHVTQVHDYTVSALATDGQSNEHGHHADHGHPYDEPNSGDGHQHALPTAAPVSPGATVICTYWVHGTRVAAAATDVSIRWLAQG